LKTRTVYQCEICGREFRTAARAEACEAKGPPPVYPAGLVYASGGAPDTFCYAVRSCVPAGHGSRVASYSVSTVKGSDRRVTETYAIEGLQLGPRHAARPGTEAFRRMVDFLTGLNLPVTFWDGGRAYPLAAAPAEPEGVAG
jgi:hypothetical protein